MKKQEDKAYINGRYNIKFIRLIKTWGKRRVEAEYDVTCDEEIIYLHLQLYQGSTDYMNMREPSPEECQDGFIKNREDQQKFFKIKGKELIKKVLIADRAIQRILKDGAVVEETYVVSRPGFGVMFKGKSKR